MVSKLIQIVRYKNNSIFSHYFNIISKSLEKCFFWWFRKSTGYCIAGMMCNSKGRFCWDGPSFDRCVYQNKSSRSEDFLFVSVCMCEKYLICSNISTFLEQLFKQVWKIDQEKFFFYFGRQSFLFPKRYFFCLNCNHAFKLFIIDQRFKKARLCTVLGATLTKSLTCLMVIVKKSKTYKLRFIFK